MDADWKIFTGKGGPHNGIDHLPDPPPWRSFGPPVPPELERKLPQSEDDDQEVSTERSLTFQIDPELIEVVNAALYLRRPLLVTGKPGSGKSSLIEAVAYELRLGSVLRWPITSRSTLREGLYDYDAIGRLQEAQLEKKSPDIGKYLELGPLGTALLPTNRPRALLIDEIDKADIDLPGDLLNIFEEGEFMIRELARLDIETVEVRAFKSSGVFPVKRGHIRCHQFPFVVLTSNGEREFPPAFLRRCIQLEMRDPNEDLLEKIVKAHLGEAIAEEADPIIKKFLDRKQVNELATDQLLNAVYLVTRKQKMDSGERDRLIEALLKGLTKS